LPLYSIVSSRNALSAVALGEPPTAAAESSSGMTAGRGDADERTTIPYRQDRKLCPARRPAFGARAGRAARHPLARRIATVALVYCSRLRLRRDVRGWTSTRIDGFDVLSAAAVRRLPERDRGQRITARYDRIERQDTRCGERGEPETAPRPSQRCRGILGKPYREA